MPAGSKGCPLEGRAMCMKVNMSVTVDSVTILKVNVIQGFMVPRSLLRGSKETRLNHSVA